MKLKRGQQVAKESNTGIVVLKWKDKRDVLMLSTIHSDNRREAQGGKENPEVITDYNNCKAFTDISDQMKSYSIAVRRGIKWFRKLAVELITGTAAINAYTIYKKISGKNISITKFREELAVKLLKLQDNEVAGPCTSTIQCKLTHMGSVCRCNMCYERLKKEGGRELATKACKQSNYKCLKCDSYFCIDCFFHKHNAFAK